MLSHAGWSSSAPPYSGRASKVACHSVASFCASAICAGVIDSASVSLRSAYRCWLSPVTRDAARLTHLWASTSSCGTPKRHAADFRPHSTYDSPVKGFRVNLWRAEASVLSKAQHTVTRRCDAKRGTPQNRHTSGGREPGRQKGSMDSERTGEIERPARRIHSG